LLGGIFVSCWNSFSTHSQRIAELENEVKALKEGRADKKDLQNVQEKLVDLTEKAAQANLVETHLKNHLDEITNLRMTSNNVLSSYNNAIGKYDTLSNQHEKELAILRAEVALLNKFAARQEALLEGPDKDLGQHRTVRFDKLAADLNAIKERLATIESALVSRPKKD
jgi:chromosome segregation ATPase